MLPFVSMGRTSNDREKRLKLWRVGAALLALPCTVLIVCVVLPLLAVGLFFDWIEGRIFERGNGE